MPQKLYPSLLCPTVKVNEEQLATDQNLIQVERSLRFINRRNLFSALVGTAVVGGLAFTGPRSADAQATTTPPITDVLNFALNLEYLEANFYLIASTGSGLSTADMGTGAGTITGSPGKLPLDATTLALAQALARDEMNHVEQLRTAITALGGTPISQPAINYAALGQISTQAQFLVTTRQFTSVGGSAYAGSAALLASNSSVLTTAARILGAEGQHQGAINYQCVRQGVVGALDPAVDAIDVPPSSSNYFSVLPANALGLERTTAQVLGIVYGVSTAATVTPPTGTVMGGFFPAGLNGNIKST